MVYDGGTRERLRKEAKKKRATRRTRREGEREREREREGGRERGRKRKGKNRARASSGKRQRVPRDYRLPSPVGQVDTPGTPRPLPLEVHPLAPHLLVTSFY
jgi:hypothetical protein